MNGVDSAWASSFDIASSGFVALVVFAELDPAACCFVVDTMVVMVCTWHGGRENSNMNGHRRRRFQVARQQGSVVFQSSAFGMGFSESLCMPRLKLKYCATRATDEGLVGGKEGHTLSWSRDSSIFVLQVCSGIRALL